MNADSNEPVLRVIESPSLEVMSECLDALAEELAGWALQREKVLARLDLRGARRARKAISALKMLDYLIADGVAYDDAVSTILEECQALLGSARPGQDRSSDSERPEKSGRRPIASVSLFDEDGLDDDKTAPGVPRGVLENYLDEVRRGRTG